jgi:hypothetical protein
MLDVLNDNTGDWSFARKFQYNFLLFTVCLATDGSVSATVY